MKLGEIKIAALKLMFDTADERLGIAELARLYEDGNYASRLHAMSEAINRAVDQLVARRVFFPKTHDFTVYAAKNILPDAERLYGVQTHDGRDIILEADAGRAFSFAVCGSGVASVEVNRGAGWETARGVTVAEGETEAAPLQFICESGGAFQNYRGRIDNAANFPVRLRFSGEYLYRISGIAVYASAFSKDSDVPFYAREVRYDLAENIPDYYKLENLSYKDTAGRYVRLTDYKLEGKDVLVLEQQGVYRAVYTPKPPSVADDTPDEQELILPEELARLIPYYVKADLYEEDEPSMAALSRNIFENRLADYLADRPESDTAGMIQDALGMGW